MMSGTDSQTGRGLRFILAGVAVNLLVGFLPAPVSLFAAGGGYGLTALGLFLAAKRERRFWLPLALVTVDTFLMDYLAVKITEGPEALLVGAGQLFLNAVVICCVCLFTLPLLKGREDAGVRQGEWAWKCEVCSAVTMLSVLLMANVPGMVELKYTLSLMSSLLMLLTAAFYLYFLWKAGSALEKRA